jgi:hypothetical protein
MSGSRAAGSLPRRRRDEREFDDPEETTMQVRTSVKSGKIVRNRCESRIGSAS